VSDLQGSERLARGVLTLRPSAGALLMAVNIAAAVAVFWYGILSLFDAWQKPEYSHGPIIPLLSAFMFLREMKAVPPVAEPVRDRWVGVAVVAGALLLGIAGLLIRVPDVVTYALILWVGGTILACFGLRRGWYFWPSVLHLVFMLPLPMLIYWPISAFLMEVSSEIGVGIVQGFGIPVFLDGNVIDLGVYKLQVAEACSGLRYLFPVMSFSYVFGVLYTGPVWHKIVILLSAAPITVLMNSVRIGIIGVMVENFGIEYAEGFLHLFEGWVIFISCVLILFALAALMQRLGPDPRPIGDSIDMDFTGIPEQIARFGRIPAAAPVIVATALTAGVALAWHGAPPRTQAEIERVPLALFPKTLGDWAGEPRLLDPEIEAVLGADDYAAVAYRHPERGQLVDLFVAYYSDLTAGKGIHSPEVCLPAGGWEVSDWQRRTLALDPGTVEGAPQVELNRAIIRKGMARQLVYFWFEQRGRRLAGDLSAKVYTIYDSLTRGRSDGALVRLTTPIAPGEPVEAAEARLREMLNRAMARMPRHVPG
jgi:exosortase D (VPLPA-CTERM-specific)